jgi:RNA polymerase sigma-70 factor, ECF subfamily
VTTRSLTLPAVAIPHRPGLAVAVSRPWWEGQRPASQRPDLSEVDADILAGARSGNRRAQEEFIRCYERRVHAFLGRSLIGRPQVDDLAQEVFLRVLRALPRFEPGSARVSTWIFSIAVRLLADQGRRARRWFIVFDDERASASGDSPEAEAMARQTLTEVERVLCELSPEQRMALALFELHGLSHAEVAGAMGSSVATVKTRLFRARRALRQRLPGALLNEAGKDRR